jgi:translation initiation factor IF-2
LSEIEAQVGKGTTNRRRDFKKKTDAQPPKSAVDTVRKITAKIDTKTKKKVYRKEKILKDDESGDVEIKPIKIVEFSNVDEISKIFNTKPNDIIQKCMSLGILATINQRLEWDVIELLAEEFGFKAERHIIFYRKLSSEEVEIIRILHERMDLKHRILEKAG